jgi:hypothetical protein
MDMEAAKAQTLLEVAMKQTAAQQIMNPPSLLALSIRFFTNSTTPYLRRRVGTLKMYPIK